MLSVFLPIGWPSPAAFLRLCQIAVDRGAGALELGIPYSDPVADGPVLQAANREALEAGSTVDRCFALLAEAHTLGVPMNLLVYGNLVHARGAFCQDAARAGAASLLVPDIPLEESAELRARCRDAGIDHVSLVGPLTPPERLARIAVTTTGYLYLAGMQAITGTDGDPAVDSIHRAVATARPVYVGFGLRRADHVRTVLRAGAASAIVGSALVRIARDEVAFGEAVAELVGGLEHAAP
jgi:tryptophan synthase alpha chain